MKKYLEVLKKCPLFEQIEDKDLLTMLTCLDAKVESFDKKYTVFAQGSPAKYIGILLRGSAQIINVDFYGNRNILCNIEPSEMFAEAFACAGVSSLPITVTANEPCDVMLINCSHILHIRANNCRFYQQLIFNLMKGLASKTVILQQKNEITSKRTTEEKLMTYLMFCAKKANTNSFDIPFNRQELADYLEVDRSGLSAAISKLRKQGVFENRKNHFVLL